MVLYYRRKGEKKYQATTIDKLEEFTKGHYNTKAAMGFLLREREIYTPLAHLTLDNPEESGEELKQQNLF